MRSDRRRKWILIGFIAVILLVRLYVSAATGLSDDEAYYWSWSKHLALSYFDHPGMVAWLNYISTSIFGDTAIGVRVFAALFYTGTAFGIWKLAAEMFSEKTAWLALAVFAVTPIFAIGGLLMVPDAPLTCFRTLAMLVSWRIFGRGEHDWKNWILLGMLLALALVSKYTIVIFEMSLLGFVFTLPRAWSQSSVFRSAKFWAVVGLAAAGAVPILIWNMQHDWLSFRYHLHDRQVGGGGFSLIRWSQFWASQVIAVGLPLVLMSFVTWWVCVKRWADLRWRFILFLSLPGFSLFCTQALFAPFRPHWACRAYIVLFIGGAQLVIEGLENSIDRRSRRLANCALAAIILTTLPMTLAIETEMLTPVIPQALQSMGLQNEWNPRFDPTNDLYGWRTAAREINRIRRQIVLAGGQEPFVSAANYALSAQIEFSLGEVVWRVAPARDAYEFWDERTDHVSLVGRDSIFVTDNRFERDPTREGLFETCALKREVPYFRDTQLARKFYLWHCHGFRGTPPSIQPVALGSVGSRLN